jgi:hypothetical protein
MSARRILVTALFFGLVSACGGGLEEARAEPSSREHDELRAREWHDHVVRLEGEALTLAEREGACPDRCVLAVRTCELAGQICDLSRADDNDEGTRVLCEDAEPRCERARTSASACSCN